MAKKVYVGQLWRTQRGNEWQVSALYRPVVGVAWTTEEFPAPPGEIRKEYEEHRVYGEEHAVMYCEQSGSSHERHVPVAKLIGWRWNWTPVK